MAFRDGPFENIKVPLVWTAAVTVVVAAIGCILLLISDARAQTSPYQPVRSGVEAVAGPVGARSLRDRAGIDHDETLQEPKETMSACVRSRRLRLRQQARQTRTYP